MRLGAGRHDSSGEDFGAGKGWNPARGRWKKLPRSGKRSTLSQQIQNEGQDTCAEGGKKAEDTLGRGESVRVGWREGLFTGKVLVLPDGRARGGAGDTAGMKKEGGERGAAEKRRVIMRRECMGLMRCAGDEFLGSKGGTFGCASACWKGGSPTERKRGLAAEVVLRGSGFYVGERVKKNKKEKIEENQVGPKGLGGGKELTLGSTVEFDVRW